MKSKLTKSLHAIVALSLLLVLRAVPASAANTGIVGGTYGANCNSGGYSTPSSVTVVSGDTVTISVPADDPYAGGMEIHGFPQGNFDIARGGSVATQPLTTDVSYYGTWPSSGCMKGTGTITVSAPVTPPVGPPPSSGASSGSTSGTSSGGTTKSTSATSSTKSTSSSPTASSTQPTTTTTPTTATTTTPTAVPATTPKSKPTKTNQPNKVATVTTAKDPALKNAATIGGGGLAVIAIGLFIAWRLLVRHRLRTPAVEPVVPGPTPTQSVVPEQISQSAIPTVPDAPSGPNSANPQDKS